MLERMLGAARLNVHTFEDVENDPSATTQAMLVVIIVSIAAAIGGAGELFTEGGNILWGLVIGIAGGLLRWALWALVVFFVGTTILKTPQTHATWGQVARCTGFAQSPGVLQVFIFIPIVGPLIAFAASIWQLVAMVIGVRTALDYDSTWRAVGVVVIGFLIVVVPLLIIMALLLAPAAMQ